MKVGIDVRTVEPRMRGIGLFTYNLVRAMASLDDAPELTLFGNAQSAPFFEKLPLVRHEEIPCSLGDAAWESAQAAERCRALGLDLYHGPAFIAPDRCGCATIVTVHDVAFVTHPQFYDEGFCRYMENETRRAVASAAMVIVNSEDTADEAVRHLGVGRDRVAVTYPGADPFLEPIDVEAAGRRVRSRHAFEGEFLLTAGLSHPRKNTVAAIRAFAALPEAQRRVLRLLVVGEGWEVNEAALELARSLGVVDRITVSGQVSTKELRDLYAASELFLFPTLHEGFGFPVLEAMASGAPVITSNVAAIPEVTGDAALLVDPTDNGAITRAISQLLADRDGALSLGERGRTRAKQFRWERTAEATVTAYQEARDRGQRTVVQVGASRRTVSIDARMLGNSHTGTGRFSTELIRRLVIRDSPDFDWVLVAPGRGVVSELGLEDRVRVMLEGQARFLDPLWDNQELAGAVRTSQASVHFSPTGILPGDLGLPAVSTVFDLGFERHPEFYSPQLLEYLRPAIPVSVAGASKLIAISEFTRQDLIERYGVASEKVEVVCPGVDHLPLMRRRQGKSPLILTVSSGGPNKRLDVLLAAFARLVRSRPGRRAQLCVLCPPSTRVARLVEQSGVAERVRLRSGVDDEELALLLAAADLFAFLSDFEGFGLPPLEAMRAGVPVVASDSAALPEVLGGAALLVEPGDVLGAAEAMSAVLSDSDRREQLICQGKQVASRLTWDGAAEHVLSIIEAQTDAHRDVANTEPRVGLVTTWATDCGIASHAEALVSEIDRLPVDLTVLAERTRGGPSGGRVERQCVRCWDRDAPFDELISVVKRGELQVLHVQHQPALFWSEHQLAQLLWQAKLSGIYTILTLHEIEPRAARAVYLVPDLIIVHTSACQEALRAMGVTGPIEVVPLGIGEVPGGTSRKVGRRLRLLSLGFLHPTKGYHQVVDALPELVTAHPGLEYRIVGARRTGAEDYPERLMRKAAELGVASSLEIVEGYHSSAHLDRELNDADVVVYPYLRTPLGASASVRLALAADRPVVTSPAPFFEDLGQAVERFEKPSGLARTILRVLEDAGCQERAREGRRRLRRDQSWAKVAHQHACLYRAGARQAAGVRGRTLSPWVSVHIIAKETDRLGLLWYRSCLESLKGYADELIIVDNGSSPEVLEMVRSELRRTPGRLIEAAHVRSFRDLRNLALEATDSRATHIHWVDTDEIFFPDQLPLLRAAMSDPSYSRISTVLVHFMIDPTRIENRQVKQNVFRASPGLRWQNDVHEVLEGVPAGRSTFVPVEHLHLGYCRPQWQTFLKWIRYAILEHGTADMYRTESVQGRTLPWLRGARTPDSILDERIPRLRPFAGEFPPSCSDWMRSWQASGKSWRDFANGLVDQAHWLRWQSLHGKTRSWERTLSDMVSAMGWEERREESEQPQGQEVARCV